MLQQASKPSSAAAINNVALAYYLKATREEDAETSESPYSLTG